MKTCTKCKIEQPLDSFHKSSARKDGYQSNCKKCRKQQFIDKLPYYRNKRKKLYADTKEQSIEYSANYYQNNKEDCILKQKTYYQNNKKRHLERTKIYNKNRRRTDSGYKLRCYVSTSVYDYLKRNSSNKNGKSVMSFLPYTIQDLKEHIEKQFEPWMNWENRGKYSSTKWNDNDSSTWTWQIDHIIPHSTFKYTSMEDDEFKNCWALTNLRPLSSKQNHIDGGTRVRHKVKI